MAIQFKRSYTAGFVPTNTDIAAGEVFINLADQLIYSKDDSNNIVVMRIEEADATTPGMVSTGAQTFAGDKTFNGRINALGDAGLHAQDGTTSIVSDDPSQRHIETRVSGVTKFSVEADGTVGNLLGSLVQYGTTSTISDFATVVFATASGITLTLPSATNKAGKLIFIKNTTGGSVTIDRPGQTSETLAAGAGKLYTTEGSFWLAALNG
jgi:hypothetical protein